MDEFGNRESVWADPAPVPVHAVAPVVSEAADEPSRPNRSMVTDALQVLAPAGTRVDARDLIVWPFRVDDAGAVAEAGVEYEIDGEVNDWTVGPWSNPVAGVTFDLRRSEG